MSLLIHDFFIFFLRVCTRLWKHACPLVIMCVPVCVCARVCAGHIFCTKPVWSSQGCFVCTLFSTLILSLAENNYSLFVSRGDGGRTTQKLASFYCFRGRHIAQEEQGVTEREREREREGERDNSRREIRPLDENANYSTSHWTSVKPPTYS